MAGSFTILAAVVIIIFIVSLVIYMRNKWKSNINLTTTTAKETSELTTVNNMYEAPTQQKETNYWN